MKSFVDYSEAE